MDFDNNILYIDRFFFISKHKLMEINRSIGVRN